jgi:hypothetical protein
VQVIKKHMGGKTPDPKANGNTVLWPQRRRTITSLMKVGNAVLRRRYFPPTWRGAHIESRERTPQASYRRPTTALDAAGKPFKGVLHNMVIQEVDARGLLRDEQFGFRPRYSTMPALLKDTIKTLTRN